MPDGLQTENFEVAAVFAALELTKTMLGAGFAATMKLEERINFTKQAYTAMYGTITAAR